MNKIDKWLTAAFGSIEITIGLVTLISLVEARFLWGITKPVGVFLFVFSTSLISVVLGVGISKYKMWARKFLIFFSGYIVLTKVFIFLGIIMLSAPFEVFIPSAVKNSISLIYHFLIILFFNRERIRHNFT